MSQQYVDLEDDLQTELLKTGEIAWKECGYNSARFVQMLHDHGGVETARRLLQGTTISYGLTQLWRCHRLDISLEAVVLRPEYAPLFSARQLDEARRRLDSLGYAPPWDV